MVKESVRTEALLSALHLDSALTDTVAKVVKLSAADLTAGNDLDFGDARAVERVDTLYSRAVGDLTNGEGGIDATSTHGEDDSLEHLDTLLTAFNNAIMDLHGITDSEVNAVRLHLLFFDLFDDIHGRLLCWWGVELLERLCDCNCFFKREGIF